MNKKQAGIIVTLLALIVCAGILAARVNGPLDVSSEISSSASDTSARGVSKTTNGNSDYFASARLDRTNSDASLLASWKTIMEDKNIAQAQKENSDKLYTAKTTAIAKENEIEQVLKGKGFTDAICFIDDNNKARIIIKAKDVSDQDRKKIKDVVSSVAKISNVEIETRQ
jgi:hypothetical protein